MIPQKKKENEFCFIFTGQATFFSFSKRGRFELKRGGVGNTWQINSGPMLYES